MTLSVLVAAVLGGVSADAKPIDIAKEDQGAIGERIDFLQEGSAPLRLGDAVKAFADGRFRASEDAVLNFGIGAAPAWLRFDVENNARTTIRRRLSIETSWIDKIDVYMRRSGVTQATYHVGDSLPFNERPIKQRLFALDLDFEPGKSTVFIRSETPDPMVLPIYLMPVEDATANNILEGHGAGFVFGVILALLAYNLMLYFSLRNDRYFFYSLYLFFSLAVITAYTGHGFQWLWPNWPRWQLWSNPVLMVASGISGLVFATRFLNTETEFPRLYRVVIIGSWAFIALEALAVLGDGHAWALLVAFSLITFFCVVMATLGAVSYFGGNEFAKYFLVASVVAALSASMTAMTTWGLVPYTIIGYRAFELGLMIEAVLLALALAHQFRIVQQDKIQAEALTKIDPLTGMNNRRGFHHLVDPLWNTGLRNQHEMSVIVLDLDRFKSINDTYGHVFGDQVLVKVAAALTDGARAGDVIARWGGEEFILFLPETAIDDAVYVAERVRSNIGRIQLKPDGVATSLTASLGVAHTDKSPSSMDELISAADKHLYRAKREGRDCVRSVMASI